MTKTLSVEELLKPSVSTANGLKGVGNAEAADSGIYTPGAKLIGLSGHSLIGRAFVLDRHENKLIYEVHGEGKFFPGYVESLAEGGQTWTGSNYQPLSWILANTGGLKSIRLDQCITILHYNLIYGHFLFEMLPKLFLLKRLYRSGRRFPLVIPKDVPQWCRSMIGELAPEVIQFEYDPDTERVDAEVLYVITGDVFFADASVRTDFMDFAEQGSLPSKKIFIVRPPNHPSRRRWKNETDLAEIAKSFGFQVVEPGSLGGLKAQAKIFGSASHVIGEFTSALHNTIFSPQGTKVLSVNRINSYQWLIANTVGQYLDYVLPPQGPVSWDGDIDFFIDEFQFRNAMANMVESD